MNEVDADPALLGRSEVCSRFSLVRYPQGQMDNHYRVVIAKAGGQAGQGDVNCFASRMETGRLCIGAWAVSGVAPRGSFSRWFGKNRGDNMKTSLTACLLAVAALAGGAATAEAAVLYSSFVSYRTGDDPYHPDSIDADPDTNFGSADAAGGTTSASLGYSGSGPLGGTFGFSGAAEAAVGTLKAGAAITLTDYGVGSYYMIDMPAGEPDYLPQSGFAQSAVTDQTVIDGPAGSYDVAFTYRLTGTSDRPTPYESWFRSSVGVGLSFSGAGVNAPATFAFYPDPGPYDSLLTLTARNVPNNTTLNLQQFLFVVLYSADSMYFGTSPCDDGSLTPPGTLPSPRPCQTGLVGDGPYSLALSGDFGHTLELQNVAVLDVGGGIAPGASLRSLNGVQYPGQTADAPEPPSLALITAGVGLMGFMTRRRRRAATT